MPATGKILMFVCAMSCSGFGSASAAGDGTADARLDTASGRIKSPQASAYMQAQKSTSSMPKKGSIKKAAP